VNGAPDQGQVRRLLVGRLADGLAAVGVSPEEVSDDFDLLHHGVVDSLGLLMALADVEAGLGVEIDYERLPPEDLARVGPLVRYIAREAGGG
jgi:acyl carrier protein